MRSLRQFWSIRRIIDDRVTLIRLGPLRLWLARAEKEWGYAVEHGELTDVMDIAQVPEDVVPHDLQWTATFFKEAPVEFFLRPSLPDRPLIVKPQYKAIIPAGESTSMNVLLPASIEIVVTTSNHEVVLGTVPSIALSDAWFGTPTEGEICYLLPFNPEQGEQDSTPLPHQIVWPVEIINRSTEELRFEKICLRSQYVGIYSGDSHLWSCPVQIVREGSYKGTTLRYDKKPPSAEADLMELTKPKKREDRLLGRLTFGTGFKRDTTFGN